MIVCDSFRLCNPLPELRRFFPACSVLFVSGLVPESACLLLLLLLFLRWVYAPLDFCLHALLDSLRGLPCALGHSNWDFCCIDSFLLHLHGRLATLPPCFSVAPFWEVFDERQGQGVPLALRGLLLRGLSWTAVVSLHAPCVIFQVGDQLGLLPVWFGWLRPNILDCVLAPWARVMDVSHLPFSSRYCVVLRVVTLYTSDLCDPIILTVPFSFRMAVFFVLAC